MNFMVRSLSAPHEVIDCFNLDFELFDLANNMVGQRLATRPAAEIK